VALPDPIVHAHQFDVVERSEGYREYRCLPTSWSWESDQEISSLVAEMWSAQKGVDPIGSADSEFWSATDAALRIRSLPPSELARRELNLLATRWETGLNAPKAWFSWSLVRNLQTMESEASDLHFTEIPTEEPPLDLWDHYGMRSTSDLPVMTGWDMRAGPAAPASEPWHGGIGNWYSWMTIAGWSSWPRLQDTEQSVSKPTPGHLLLFVSHRWEHVEHPDPTARQIRALQTGLTIATARAVQLQVREADRTASGLPELIVRYASANDLDLEAAGAVDWAEQVETIARSADLEREFLLAVSGIQTPAPITGLRESILIWYDFASMYQEPRSPMEHEAFSRELLELVAIQQAAGTIVIAGDQRYFRRAWCFLELCVGMRNTVSELTPSWGHHIGARESLTRWAGRSDQLIGALNSLGLDGLAASGLRVTDAADLPTIARLLASLPLVGRVGSDDSDVVGGAMPLPLREGGWCLNGVSPPARRTEATAAAVPSGLVVDQSALAMATEHAAGANALDLEVGVWAYTTQRTLSLSWAARAEELMQWLADAVARVDPDVAGSIRSGGEPAVSCTWADAIGLADDGVGWTRFIPSTAELLVIFTQPVMPEICRIYERIRSAHLACGVPVITAFPHTGMVVIDTPAPDLPDPETTKADVLVVPRVRRSTAYPRQLMVDPNVPATQIELIPALRMIPAEGYVGVGKVTAEAAAAGLWDAGTALTPDVLLDWADKRARAEALARSATASWDTWARPRLGPAAWACGMAGLQLTVFERLISEVARVSDNPLVRRRLLYVLVKDHEGYALHPSIVDDARQLVTMVLESETPV
jgi:hypothetical protein